MDLSNLKLSDSSTRMLLRNPDTDEIIYIDDEHEDPMHIDLISSDAKEYRSLVHRQNNARMKEVKVVRNKIKGISSERSEEEALDLLLAATKGMRIKLEGAIVGSTPDERRKVYDEFLWIREQATAFVDDRVAHMGES